MFVTVLRVVLPFLLLIGGGALAAMVLFLAPKAERKPPPVTAQLVELAELSSERKVATVRATGLVTPQQEVRLTPQISGKVVFIAKSLVPGGRVRKGQVLLRVDSRDYRLAVEQLKGQVQSGELQVEQEHAQQALAKHEWRLLGEEGDAPPLFSRKSQQAAADANLHAGKSALNQAKLSLSRTAVTAPFDATIISKGVDVGQVVTPQSQLAYLVGTGEMWVVASLPVEDLDLIRVPGLGESAGSKATVTQHLARGKTIVRQGEVTRLVEQLDPKTRRAQVVVTIQDALSATDRLPLLPGAYVEVVIEGREFEGVYTLPRESVYNGNQVWIAVDSGGKKQLQSRQIEPVWADREQLFVSEGLKAGEQLVLTRLSNPLPGTEIKALDREENSEATPENAEPIASPPGAGPPPTSARPQPSGTP